MVSNWVIAKIVAGSIIFSFNYHSKQRMAKTVLYVLGAVLTLVGILGFVLPSPLLGLFAVNSLHNVVHLATGIVFLGVAFMAPMQSAMAAKVFGVVYAVVAILGLVMGGDMLLGLIAVNMMDHILHVALALVLLYVGFMGGRSSAPMQGPMPMA